MILNSHPPSPPPSYITCIISPLPSPSPPILDLGIRGEVELKARVPSPIIPLEKPWREHVGFASSSPSPLSHPGEAKLTKKHRSKLDTFSSVLLAPPPLSFLSKTRVRIYP